MYRLLGLLAFAAQLSCSAITIEIDCNPADPSSYEPGRRCVAIGQTEQQGFRVLDGKCSTSKSCSTGVCDLQTKTCVPCTSDSECTNPDNPRLNPNEKYCVTENGDLKGQCVQCKGTGPASMGCTAANAPVCGADRSCVACSKHSDCASGVCKMPEYGYDSTIAGSCASAAEITAVADSAQLAAALGDAKRFILAKAGDYDPITIGAASIDKIIVGPGRDVDAFARIKMDGGNVSLNFLAGGKVIFDGVHLAGTANCLANGSLTLLRTIVNVNIQTSGVVAGTSSCVSLTVGQSVVMNAGKSGIVIGSGTPYKIYNTLVVDSAKTSGSAVVIDSEKAGVFAFNTIVQNTFGGVLCSNAVPVTSSIIVNNGQLNGANGKGQGKDQVGTLCQLKDVVLGLPQGPVPAGSLPGMPAFASAGQSATDFKLADDNMGQSRLCCIRTSSLDSSVTTDFFGSTRGAKFGDILAGKKTDVGFHEFQPQ